ncbi:MAG: hypothetical protein KAG37_08665, partial [Flavobacteriales bacterium]|nr:hypothetical protein [Flavobacteriales bacterium]
NDGSNKSYSLHNVAGKTLEAIFGGDNHESQHVDITQLRGDFFEWFKLEDGSITLVNCSVVAKDTDAVPPAELIEVTADVYEESSTGNVLYKNTTYFVKAPATWADLDAQIVSAEKEWINVYIKNTTGTEEPYLRVDINTNGVEESLKKLLEDNNIDKDSLYYDFKDWYTDVNGNNHQLIKCNIKAVEVTSITPVKVYSNLYAEGAHDHYLMTGYKIEPSAVDADLEIIIKADDVDFVSIYKKILNPLGYKKIDVLIETDITIKDILIAEGIAVNKLKEKYREWFYVEKENGSFLPTIKNINFKAVQIIGEVPRVVKTTDLFSTGTWEYENIAYLVNGKATLAEMNAYELTGNGDLSIKHVDADGLNTTTKVQSTAGLKLGDVLATA